MRVFSLAAVCAAALSAAVSFVSAPAAACGVDSAVFPTDQRDLGIRPTNVAASDLLAEARRLETRASTLDTLAAERERRAQEQLVDARALRIEAASTEGRERAQLLGAAESLAQQAMDNREQARRVREQSSALRTQARIDRQRAVQLVGLQQNNGNNWRNRRQLPPSAANNVDL